MDFRGKKYERGSNWSDPEVVELLQLWADDSVQIELESCLRNQHVFNRIAEVLREKGILRTGDQCREKIKKMKLDYRRIKDNQKTVRGGRTWKFYEVMDRVLTNRPSVSYSSLGGTVISHQVLQGAPGSDAFLLHNLPAAAFSSPSSGSLLFGHPPKPGDLLEIKREDVDSDDGLLNSDPQPPELLYQIAPGDEPDADSKSLGLDQEDLTEMGRGEGVENARFSPSGYSEQNMASSSGTGGSTGAPAAGGRGRGGGRGGEDGDGDRDGLEPRGPRGPAPLWQRKRRRVGCGGGAAGDGRARAGLDAALVRFLGWQRVAEERLISLEEARMEREAEAEERRERMEARRAEQDRQHELRLFTAFASALSAVCPGAAQNLAHTPAQNPAQPAGPAVPERDAQTPRDSVYLSSRGNLMDQAVGILHEGFALYQADKHDFDSNRDGIINLGTSENKLCYDLLSKRLTQADMLHVAPALLEYPDLRGHCFLREEVASFLTEYSKSSSPLKVENVVVMNGCTSLFSCITAVICDPGDAVLIPTPFYGSIKEDVGLYSGVRLVHTHLDCEVANWSGTGGPRHFLLTTDKLEQAMEQAKAEGVRVRAVIFMNPHNPLGEIYSGQEMTAFLEFAKRHELHAIIDEVYMLSVFSESAAFQSVLSLARLPDAQRTHVLWGLSKNQDVLSAMAHLGFFHVIAGIAQHQAAMLLRDRDWVSREFLPQNRARMEAAHRYISGELRSLGIPFLNRPACFFIWADLRKVLSEQSFPAERKLWRCFLHHKILVSPGEAFSCSTPGWFRIIFTDQEDRLRLGMQRLRKALAELGWVSDQQDAVSVGPGRGLENGDQTPGLGNGADEVTSKRDSPAPPGAGASASLVDEDLVVLDRQSSRLASGSSLDSLIGTLRRQIRSCDWLEKNTPEVSAGEDPELFDVFRDLLHRARK
ncbi:hypothetical protein COCON_G00219540 [Conger conger]|uniref:1-aminocyclopropane-1-carboxylate synthase-like protein 1 n=1 Tax=Conger conger TaxID=82655 RepID=A0A9Q1CY95_CONCO|nr:hypothetical protein COCON_G00219540 [Conger conger]